MKLSLLCLVVAIIGRLFFYADVRLAETEFGLLQILSVNE